MLGAIDGFARSIDRAARSMDPSLAQQSVDRATIDRSRCAFDGYPFPFFDSILGNISLPLFVRLSLNRRPSNNLHFIIGYITVI